jgi:hypothetical protein
MQWVFIALIAVGLIVPWTANLSLPADTSIALLLLAIILWMGTWFTRILRRRLGLPRALAAGAGGLLAGALSLAVLAGLFFLMPVMVGAYLMFGGIYVAKAIVAFAIVSAALFFLLA